MTDTLHNPQDRDRKQGDVEKEEGGATRDIHTPSPPVVGPGRRMEDSSIGSFGGLSGWDL